MLPRVSEVANQPPTASGRVRRKQPTNDDLPMYKMAYDEAKRLVDDQVAELDGIRQRSVQFLAFIGTGTAFLVRRV
jgi:hypothetical protein